MRIIRTVLPLIAGVVARALCDIPQALNQPFSPTFWFVTQPASVTNKPTAMMLEILIFDSIPFVRFGSVTRTPAFEQGSRHIRSVLRCRLTFPVTGAVQAVRRLHSAGVHWAVSWKCSIDESQGNHSVTLSLISLGRVKSMLCNAERLTLKISLVGNATDKSAGFAPRRILSTYSAAR